MTGQDISLVAATVTLIALLGRGVWRQFKGGESRLDHPAIFFLLIFSAILVLRLPLICWPQEVNPDESQMLVQGWRYLSHPVPWRDVDGTTSGPLDSWFLSAPMALGAPVSWVTDRAMLWAAQCATLLFVYLAVRCFSTRAEAQFSLMPLVLFYAFSRDKDCTHYASEIVPVLLISVVVWLLARAWATGRFSHVAIFFTGFFAGCIPFAKLQASPMAAYLVVAGMAQLIFIYRGKCRPKAGLLCLGAVIFPALLLGVVFACGAGDDFWKSYILASRGYAGDAFTKKVVAFVTVLTWETDFRSYFISAWGAGMLLAGVWAHVRRPKPGSKLITVAAASVGLVIVASLSVLVAGKGFRHYLHLLVPPVAICFGLAFIAAKTLLLAEKTEPKASFKPIYLLLAGFAVVISLQLTKLPDYVKTMRGILSLRITEPKSYVSRRVSKVGRPGDTMSIWGWTPSLYMETGMLPATRDAIGHYMIEAGPYQDYFRRRYLGDLERARPAVFIDAMGDGLFVWMWTQPETRRHESFPQLASFVDENYSLWLTIHMFAHDPPASPLRIYLLKQRMTELNLTPEEITFSANPSPKPK